MPKLLAFLPCERVIISADENAASLITLFQGFKIRGVPEEAPDEQHPQSLPIRWSVFTQWHRLSEDEGKTFEQKVELLSPSGKVLVAQSSDFAMVKRIHRNTGVTFGFPVTGPGQYLVRLWLRTGRQGEFAFVADYPIVVELDAASPPAAAALTDQQRTAEG